MGKAGHAGHTKHIKVQAYKDSASVIGPITVSLSQSSNQFEITKNTCAALATLKAGHKCRVLLRTVPNASASPAATLTVGAVNAAPQTAILQVTVPN
jgi:hypothetical protein